MKTQNKFYVAIIVAMLLFTGATSIASAEDGYEMAPWEMQFIAECMEETYNDDMHMYEQYMYDLYGPAWFEYYLYEMNDSATYSYLLEKYIDRQVQYEIEQNGGVTPTPTQTTPTQTTPTQTTPTQTTPTQTTPTPTTPTQTTPTQTTPTQTTTTQTTPTQTTPTQTTPTQTTPTQTTPTQTTPTPTTPTQTTPTQTTPMPTASTKPTSTATAPTQTTPTTTPTQTQNTNDGGFPIIIVVIGIVILVVVAGGVFFAVSKKKTNTQPAKKPVTLISSSNKSKNPDWLKSSSTETPESSDNAAPVSPPTRDTAQTPAQTPTRAPTPVQTMAPVQTTAPTSAPAPAVAPEPAPAAQIRVMGPKECYSEVINCLSEKYDIAHISSLTPRQILDVVESAPTAELTEFVELYERMRYSPNVLPEQKERLSALVAIIRKQYSP